jgi:hypothetical protein
MRELMMADLADLGVKDSQVLLICLIAAIAILVVIVRDYLRQLAADAEADAADELAYEELDGDGEAEEPPFRQVGPQPMSAGEMFGRRRAA